MIHLAWLVPLCGLLVVAPPRAAILLRINYPGTLTVAGKVEVSIKLAIESDHR